MDIKIVVLSKGRSSNVSTKSVVDIDFIVCPHDEVELYKEHNPEIEIIGQPKEVRGITMARQFVLDTFEEVFMLDDDVEFIRNFFNGEGEKYKIESKKMAKEIIMQTASIAKQMGAKMFGYTNQRRPIAYRSQRPFRTTGYLNASHCGFLKGHGLKYDMRMVEGEDHFISGLNVFKNRFMLIDDRYGFMTTENFKNDGGCAGDRNIEILQYDTLLLREMFGEVIVTKKIGTHKKNINEGERSMKFPY